MMISDVQLTDICYKKTINSTPYDIYSHIYIYFLLEITNNFLYFTDNGAGHQDMESFFICYTNTFMIFRNFLIGFTNSFLCFSGIFYYKIWIISQVF